MTGCCLWLLGDIRQHTELHNVGWAKIKTNWTWTDVITLNHLLILFFTVGGFDYFAEAYPDAKVYAHKTLQGYMQQLLNVRNKITQKRAVFQFGTELSDKEHENSGIGIRLKLVGFFCSSKVEKI